MRHTLIRDDGTRLCVEPSYDFNAVRLCVRGTPEVVIMIPAGLVHACMHAMADAAVLIAQAKHAASAEAA